MGTSQLTYEYVKIAECLSHRQPNPLPLQIDFEDFDGDMLVDFDNRGGVFDEAVGEFGDMHEAILMHADVDERAEMRDIRHDAGQLHADLEITDSVHTFVELE